MCALRYNHFVVMHPLCVCSVHSHGHPSLHSGFLPSIGDAKNFCRAVSHAGGEGVIMTRGRSLFICIYLYFFFFLWKVVQ